jgi:hypothetical protein
MKESKTGQKTVGYQQIYPAFLDCVEERRALSKLEILSEIGTIENRKSDSQHTRRC